jgi:hypothetical protein
MILTSRSRVFFVHCLKLHTIYTEDDALSEGPFKSDQIAYFMTKTHANSIYTAINMLGICNNNARQAMILYLHITAYLEHYLSSIGLENPSQQMFEIKIWQFAEYMWERRKMMLAPYFAATRPEEVARDPSGDGEARWENPPLT